MKPGHEAVMQRWLISAQKLRRTPSAMTSRPPSSTTRVFAVRSLRLLIIFSKSLVDAEAFNHVRHHGITGGISEGFLAIRQGVSNHGEYARTDPSADSDPLVASNPDDRWNERGEGKAQALARALAEAQEDKAGRVSGQTYDPRGPRAGPAPLRGRSSPSGARASRRRRGGHYRHRHRRSDHG